MVLDWVFKYCFSKVFFLEFFNDHLSVHRSNSREHNEASAFKNECVFLTTQFFMLKLNQFYRVNSIDFLSFMWFVLM